MSKWLEYLERMENCIEDLYSLKSDAEESRYLEYSAAVKVQSWYRGNKWRKHLQYLNSNAMTIQKYWRGYYDRIRFESVVRAAVDKMCWARFHKAATIIQSRWRGYRVRKYQFDYYDYRRYLSRVEIANGNLMEFINKHQELKDKEYSQLKELKSITKMQEWALKNHHLISTKAQPGIYNSPFRRNILGRETLLKESEKQLVKTDKQQPAQQKSYPYDPACLIATEKPLPLKHLPPLPSMAPQGPFKAPKEVRDQRYRPLNPSLRVATDFYSLEKARQAMKNEEWTQRLHDIPFKPIINREPHYQPLLITSTDYGSIAYGTVHFREEKIPYFINENVEQVPFKTIVPPINNFDKLNKQYVENYSI